MFRKYELQMYALLFLKHFYYYYIYVKYHKNISAKDTILKNENCLQYFGMNIAFLFLYVDSVISGIFKQPFP